MKEIKGKLETSRGFTLIELLVVIAVLGVLVLLAMPMFNGYTKDANFAKGIANAKMIEDASQLYYMDNDDWPRLTDEHYTSEELEEYSERIYDITGKEVNLNPEGNYYDIDYYALDRYIKIPDDKRNYILQNPVGKVYYMEGLTEQGKDRVDYPKENPYEEIDLEELKEPNDFNFTGSVQTFEVPATGIYLLEVWGAKGQDQTTGHRASGGKGGYAKGEVSLDRGETIYIYNGGGLGDTFNGGGTVKYEGKAGGGATHIAKRPGLLSELEDHKSDVLIVAGGGGGAAGYSSQGGAGGGLEGGSGTYENKRSTSNGATQYEGGKPSGVSAYGQNSVGYFGQGGIQNPSSSNSSIGRSSGGGGGWYGGGGGGNGYSSGGGGSSYIGNVQNGETLSGNESMPNPNGGEMIGNSGHGSSKITYIGK